MPCNSDYLNPTDRERQLQRAAKLYVYVLHRANMARNTDAERAAGDIYCKADFVPALCQLLRGIGDRDAYMIIYGDPRSPTARDLADWWEAHQAADKTRQAMENSAAAQRLLLLSAFDKLKDDEKQAIVNWAGKELP